jgi:hypothetical protein
VDEPEPAAPMNATIATITPSPHMHNSRLSRSPALRSCCARCSNLLVTYRYCLAIYEARKFQRRAARQESSTIPLRCRAWRRHSCLPRRDSSRRFSNGEEHTLAIGHPSGRYAIVREQLPGLGTVASRAQKASGR